MKNAVKPLNIFKNIEKYNTKLKIALKETYFFLTFHLAINNSISSILRYLVPVCDDSRHMSDSDDTDDDRRIGIRRRSRPGWIRGEPDRAVDGDSEGMRQEEVSLLVTML
jgi:hypothetical protein